MPQPSKKYTQKSVPPPIREIEAETGKELLHVHLSNAPIRAMIYAEDYEFLLAVGVSPVWYLIEARAGYEYIRAHQSGKERLATIARVIVGAVDRSPVKYLGPYGRYDLRRQHLG